MGRRKKKANGRKRSLLFEDSPVDTQRLPLSPVPCADNPVTAVPVRVDSACSVSWISPQFDGIKLSRGRPRRRQRHNISSHAGEKSVKEKPRNRRSRNNSHRKYPALQFVSDVKSSEKFVKRSSRSGRLTEPLEDGRVSMVNENIGNNKSKDRTDSDSRDVLSSDVNHDTIEGENHDNIEGEHYSCVETVRRRSSFRKSTDKHHRPSLAHCLVYRDRHSDSPADFSHYSSSSVQRKRPKESSQLFTRLQSNHSASQSEDEISDMVRGNRRKACNSDILQSPLETSSLSQSSRNTPVAPGQIQIPVRMALFIHSPSEESFCKSTSRYPSQQHSDSQNKNVGHRASSHHGSVKTRNKEERLSQCSPTVQQEGKVRRSKRLQDKLREALRYLQPGTPDQRCCSNILVHDTPENECGLTIKQRQRLKMKAKQ